MKSEVHTGPAPWTTRALALAAALAVALLVPAQATAGINRWTATGPTPFTPLHSAVSPNFAVDRTIFIGDTTGVAVSRNGGAAWERVGQAAGIGWVSALAVAPNFDASAGFVMAGTDRGLFQSSNGGATWSAGTSWPSTFWVTSVAFSPAFGTDRTMFAAYWRSGTYANYIRRGIAVSRDAGANWVFQDADSDDVPGVLGQPGLRVAVSPAYSSDRTVLLTGGLADILKSVDGGESWQPLPGSWIGLQGTAWTTWSPSITAVGFSPDYSTDHTLFAVGDMYSDYHYLFRSTDSGSTWRQVPLRVAYGAQTVGVTDVPQFSPTFATDHTMFVVSGVFFKSTDGGANWSPRGPLSRSIFAFGVASNTQFFGRVYSDTTDKFGTFTIGPRQKIFLSHLHARTVIGRAGKEVFIKGTIGAAHPTVPVVKFRLEKKVGGHWVHYSWTSATVDPLTDKIQGGILWRKMSVGRYRVRTYHRDLGECGHLASYSPYLYFTRGKTFTYWHK